MNPNSYNARRKRDQQRTAKSRKQSVTDLTLELERYKKQLLRIQERAEQACKAYPENDHIKAVYFATLITP